MITNLVFKRTTMIENTPQEEIKVVEVNIPGIKKSEKWSLLAMVDAVSVENRNETVDPTPIIDTQPTEPEMSELKEAKPDKFPSPKLTDRLMVRTGDCIRVVNRKGTRTTTYNAVSISEVEKIEFYKSFRSKNPDPRHRTSESIVLRKSDVVADNGYGTQPYEYWDNFMKQRFIIEQAEYMKRMKGSE